MGSPELEALTRNAQGLFGRINGLAPYLPRGAPEKGQREFFLRQQLKAIQEELGEGDS